MEKQDEEWLGDSIKNNSYILGEIHLSGNKVKPYDGKLKIKVHGNTSAIFEQKKPYKLQLSVPADLIGNENSHAAKDWVLLSNGNSLNTYIGTFISRSIGLEWQPEVMLVNVVINGDWKGCYYLSEAINPEISDNAVTKDGVIFENDAYWWKNDRAYFKTKNQYPQMGYTIKYPEVNEKNLSEMEWLASYVQTFEDAIEEEDDSYQHYIDENTFIRSIMVKDILGIYDGAGSNMFFYISDINHQSSTDPQICMGPVWDFDSAFTLEDFLYHQISLIQYLNDLFQKESFYQTYLDTWDQVSVSLYKEIKEELERLLEEDGQSIQQSWQLDAVRWKKEAQDLPKHIVYVLNRMLIVKNILVQRLGRAAIPLRWNFYSDYKRDKCELQFYIDEITKENGIMSIEGWIFGLNRENREIPDCEVCIPIGKCFYRAIRINRKDVADAFGFSDERIGFFLNIDLEDENCEYIEKSAEKGRFCFIDEKNKILYQAERK